MSKATCKVDECTIPVKRGGYCYGHYMKNWRYGTPTPEHGPRWEDLRGQRFGALVVLFRVPGAWLCRCDCGATSRVRAGDLNRGSAVSCGDRTVHRKEDATYSAVHERLRADRGRASDYDCTDCGKPAYHWSYDHEDPNERCEQIAASLVAYSIDQDHYFARCVPCHKRYDLDRLNSTPTMA